jgi:hypothetical protein
MARFVYFAIDGPVPFSYDLISTRHHISIMLDMKMSSYI